MKLKKKYNKLFLFLFINIFLFSFISASFGYNNLQNVGTFKLGDDINLIQTCSNCTFNNITSILSPNSIEIIGNFQMTKVGSVYNFTLTPGNVTQLGGYIVNGIGDLDGLNAVWNYNFEITTSGNPPLNQGEGITLFGIIIILILTTIFFMISTIYIENLPFKIFLGSLSVLMLISTIGFGVTIMQQLFGAFTNLVSGYSLFFRLFMILLTAAGIGLILFLVVFALKMFNKSRGIIE